MANQWFRMYSEFLSDPKVQMMSEQFQRRLVMLFCIRCNGGVTLHDDEVAFQLRISSVDWGETKAEFMRRGFIDSDNNVLNWDKRQYRSDSSAVRVARYRSAKKQACNVTVTPPDTDTEQNTFTKVKDADALFWESCKAYLGANKSSLIGRWVKDHGKGAVFEAVTQAQRNNPADPVTYIGGILRGKSQPLPKGEKPKRNVKTLTAEDAHV